MSPSFFSPKLSTFLINGTHYVLNAEFSYFTLALWELVSLPLFISGGRKLNTIGYEDETLLMADTERNLHNLLNSVLKETATKKKDSPSTEKCQKVLSSERSNAQYASYKLEMPTSSR